MQKPRRNFWQIWNMSFGFLGIQFGWGLQMANMSAIYEFLGARADQIPLLWLAAPLTGLIVRNGSMLMLMDALRIQSSPAVIHSAELRGISTSAIVASHGNAPQDLLLH